MDRRISYLVPNIPGLNKDLIDPPLKLSVTIKKTPSTLFVSEKVVSAIKEDGIPTHL